MMPVRVLVTEGDLQLELTRDEVEGFETHIFSLKKVGKKKEFKAFKKLLDEYCQKRKATLEQETKKVIRIKL